MLKNKDIDSNFNEFLKDDLLTKPAMDNTRTAWELNIETFLATNENRDDEALLSEFLNDSDLEDYKW
ncbi:MAG: hypothetical protein PHZ10_08255 [Aliarcobacter cryaerophilus]|nr:hypothetical protein [Aliarcobacter cryaerophilus]